MRNGTWAVSVRFFLPEQRFACKKTNNYIAVKRVNKRRLNKCRSRRELRARVETGRTACVWASECECRSAAVVAVARRNGSVVCVCRFSSSVHIDYSRRGGACWYKNQCQAVCVCARGERARTCVCARCGVAFTQVMALPHPATVADQHSGPRLPQSSCHPPANPHHHHRTRTNSWLASCRRGVCASSAHTVVRFVQPCWRQNTRDGRVACCGPARVWFTAFDFSVRLLSTIVPSFFQTEPRFGYRRPFIRLGDLKTVQE